jgi:hypothetical protein
MSNEDDLELRLWSILAALRHQRGANATWALVVELMPKKAANRPRNPGTERLLRLSYELQESAKRTGNALSLTAAAKQIDKEHNPVPTGNTWQNIVREHKRLLKVRRQAHAMRGTPLSEHERRLGDDIFFGFSRDEHK